MNLQSCGKTDRTNDLMFKEYKRYKKKKPEPDFSDVIDFCNIEKYKHLVKNIQLSIDKNTNKASYCNVGLKHPSKWQVYEVTSSPGFLVIPNPFVSKGAQSYWIKNALTDYTKKPYPCNLDIFMAWDKEKSFWEICHSDGDKKSLIQQLRWVHMGYHFDYNVVDYKQKQYFGFPNDLALLTKTVADVFDFPNYYPETGIINYYPEGSSMGAHTDHYEEELAQPLIAYSFGQSAIYLIGGQTRDVNPTAIWVRSGDVMLMTGPARTAFHAVPRICSKPLKTSPSDIGIVSWKDDNDDDKEICDCRASSHIWSDVTCDTSWKDFETYLDNTRININIRQVHKYDKTLCKDKT